MTEYLIPTGPGEAELVEKRSRFLGHVARAESEEEARAFVEAAKKKHYDARHNCWCYRIRGGVERYSDDGEPQGTAGQPMLNVFQRQEVENAVCVVTRYFGGVLLGAGGLVRAYTQAARDALEVAGISVVRRWVAMEAVCPYPYFERVKQELFALGGVEEEHGYAEAVTVRALLPEGAAEGFAARLVELSGGKFGARTVGEVWKDVPVHREL